MKSMVFLCRVHVGFRNLGMGEGNGYLPQILVNPNLDTDTPPLGTVNVGILADRPSVLPEVLPRRDDHVPHELAPLHERRAESFGARPGLRAAAVEVDTGGIRGDKGRSTGELEGNVGAELDNCRGLRAKGGDGEVAVSGELVAVELFGENHGRPAEISAVFVNSLAEGELGWLSGACCCQGPGLRERKTLALLYRTMGALV